jgi:hypothetical protein
VRERDVGKLVAKAVEAARPEYRRFIAALIEGDRAEAGRAGRRFFVLTARSLLLADLAGRADVWDSLPRPATFRKEASYVSGLGLSVTADPDTSRILVGPYLAAVRRFESRIPRLRVDVDRLSRASMRTAAAILARETDAALPILAKRSVALREAIERSFWVSDVDEPVVHDIKGIMADVIRGTPPAKEGEKSLPDFIDRARAAGAQNLTDARLETIYRTNLMAANGEARAATLADPDVKRVQPLSMILEVRDRRTRGAPGGTYRGKGSANPGYHYQMHGYINTIEELRRLDLVPPNGYNCRGQLRGVPTNEARRLGLLDAEGKINVAAVREYNGERQSIVDRGLYPDPGFRRIGVVPATVAA